MVSLCRELITTSKEVAQVLLEETLNARIHNTWLIYVHYSTCVQVTTFSTDICLHVYMYRVSTSRLYVAEVSHIDRLNIDSVISLLNDT